MIAVGIYIEISKGQKTTFQRIQPNNGIIFFKNTLSNIDTQLLETDYCARIQPGELKISRNNDEYIYLYRSSLNPHIIFAVKDHYFIPQKELTNLILNLHYAFRTQGEDNGNQLKAIISNPVNYINCNIDRISQINNDLQEVKKNLLMAIDKAIRRYQSIEILLQKTEKLKIDSEIVFDKSKKMNRCCH